MFGGAGPPAVGTGPLGGPGGSCAENGPPGCCGTSRPWGDGPAIVRCGSGCRVFGAGGLPPGGVAGRACAASGAGDSGPESGLARGLIVGGPARFGSWTGSAPCGPGGCCAADEPCGAVFGSAPDGPTADGSDACDGRWRGSAPDSTAPGDAPGGGVGTPGGGVGDPRCGALGGGWATGGWAALLAGDGGEPSGACCDGCRLSPNGDTPEACPGPPPVPETAADNAPEGGSTRSEAASGATSSPDMPDACAAAGGSGLPAVDGPRGGCCPECSYSKRSAMASSRSANRAGSTIDAQAANSFAGSTLARAPVGCGCEPGRLPAPRADSPDLTRGCVPGAAPEGSRR